MENPETTREESARRNSALVDTVCIAGLVASVFVLGLAGSYCVHHYPKQEKNYSPRDSWTNYPAIADRENLSYK